jgi:hypothetical protein
VRNLGIAGYPLGCEVGAFRRRGGKDNVEADLVMEASTDILGVSCPPDMNVRDH